MKKTFFSPLLDQNVLLTLLQTFSTIRFVDIDSHILASPVIADLNSDGSDEIVIAVSYYFDPQVFIYFILFFLGNFQSDKLLGFSSRRKKDSKSASKYRYFEVSIKHK